MRRLWAHRTRRMGDIGPHQSETPHNERRPPHGVGVYHSGRSHHNNGATPVSSAKPGSNLPVQGCWKYDQEKELRLTFMLGHSENVNQLR